MKRRPRILIAIIVICLVLNGHVQAAIQNVFPALGFSTDNQIVSASELIDNEGVENENGLEETLEEEVDEKEETLEEEVDVPEENLEEENQDDVLEDEEELIEEELIEEESEITDNLEVEEDFTKLANDELEETTEEIEEVEEVEETTEVEEIEELEEVEISDLSSLLQEEGPTPYATVDLKDIIENLNVSIKNVTDGTTPMLPGVTNNMGAPSKEKKFQFVLSFELLDDKSMPVDNVLRITMPKDFPIHNMNSSGVLTIMQDGFPVATLSKDPSDPNLLKIVFDESHPTLNDVKTGVAVTASFNFIVNMLEDEEFDWTFKAGDTPFNFKGKPDLTGYKDDEAKVLKKGTASYVKPSADESYYEWKVVLNLSGKKEASGTYQYTDTFGEDYVLIPFDGTSDNYYSNNRISVKRIERSVLEDVRRSDEYNTTANMVVNDYMSRFMSDYNSGNYPISSTPANVNNVSIDVNAGSFTVNFANDLLASGDTFVLSYRLTPKDGIWKDNISNSAEFMGKSQNAQTSVAMAGSVISKSGRLTIEKLDESTGEPLENVEFTLESNVTGLIRTAETDENGIANFGVITGPFLGESKIIENTPEGYEDLESDVGISVDNDYKVTLLDDQDGAITVTADGGIGPANPMELKVLNTPITDNPEEPEDPEDPEIPEDPEDPENPEDPEDPEDPDSPTPGGNTDTGTGTGTGTITKNDGTNNTSPTNRYTSSIRTNPKTGDNYTPFAIIISGLLLVAAVFLRKRFIQKTK